MDEVDNGNMSAMITGADELLVVCGSQPFAPLLAKK